jgi:hypothetical protein
MNSQRKLTLVLFVLVVIVSVLPSLLVTAAPPCGTPQAGPCPTATPGGTNPTATPSGGFDGVFDELVWSDAAAVGAITSTNITQTAPKTRVLKTECWSSKRGQNGFAAETTPRRVSKLRVSKLSPMVALKHAFKFLTGRGFGLHSGCSAVILPPWAGLIVAKSTSWNISGANPTTSMAQFMAQL